MAVICSLATSHLHSVEPCESYAQHQKIDRYAAAFENSDYDFAPVVFETSGAVNKEGETVLKQIIRFASKREGISHTVYASRAWARLSCCFSTANFEPRLCRRGRSRRPFRLTCSTGANNQTPSSLVLVQNDLCCILTPSVPNKILTFFEVQPYRLSIIDKPLSIIIITIQKSIF